MSEAEWECRLHSAACSFSSIRRLAENGGGESARKIFMFLLPGVHAAGCASQRCVKASAIPVDFNKILQRTGRWFDPL